MLVLRGGEAAQVRIVDGRERVVDLVEGERRRLRLDTSAGTATITVERGTANVERVVTITEARSEA